MTFFGFPKVKCLHLTGGVDKSVKLSCQIFSKNFPKNHQNGLIFDSAIQKVKGGRFGGHSVVIV